MMNKTNIGLILPRVVKLEPVPFGVDFLFLLFF